MALLVTTLHGLSRTYLDEVGGELIRGNPESVAITYRRTGDAQSPLKCRVTDAMGLVSDDIVEMRHDCLSCLVREHTYEELRRLDQRGVWTHALVSLPPGVDASAFPQLAEVFQEDEADDFTMSISSCIVVCDAVLLQDQLENPTLLRDWDLSVIATDERSVGEVVARYVEFADVIVTVNTHRLRSESECAFQEVIAQLNPDALVCEFERIGAVAPAQLWSAGFDLDHPRRQSPITSEYIPPQTPMAQHVNKVIWRGDRPLHPLRYSRILDEALIDVFRSRGNLWFATHVTSQIGWESVGELCSLAIIQPWNQTTTGAENYLIMVGHDLDILAIQDALNGCLLTDAEMSEGIDAWKSLEDPFADALRTMYIEEGE
jgi:G3E family GTPase